MLSASSRTWYSMDQVLGSGMPINVPRFGDDANQQPLERHRAPPVDSPSSSSTPVNVAVVRGRRIRCAPDRSERPTSPRPCHLTRPNGHGVSGAVECSQSPARGHETEAFVCTVARRRARGSSLSGEDVGRVKRSSLVLPSLVAMLLSFDGSSAASSREAVPVGSWQPASGSELAMVELAGDPLTVSPRTAPAGSAKVDLRSAAVRSGLTWRPCAMSSGAGCGQRARLPASPASTTSPSTPSASSSTAPRWPRSGGADGRIRRAAAGVHARRPRRPRPRARPRQRGVDRGRRRGERGRGRQGRGHRQRHRRSPTPASTTRAIRRRPSSATPTLTNNKVIVAKVFSTTRSSKDGARPDGGERPRHPRRRHRSPATPTRRPSIDGVDIPYDPSGVAPRALLGNYNVFPGETGERAFRGHPRRARRGVRRRVRRRQHEPRRRPQRRRRRLPARQRDRQPRPGQHGRRRRRRQRGPRLLHRPLPRRRAAGPDRRGQHGRPQRSSTSSTVDGTDYEAVVGDFGSITSDLSGAARGGAAPPASTRTTSTSRATASPPLPDLTGKIALLGRGDVRLHGQDPQRPERGRRRRDHGQPHPRRGAVRHVPQRPRAAADDPGRTW